jgi:hypothetical protein
MVRVPGCRYGHAHEIGMSNDNIVSGFVEERSGSLRIFLELVGKALCMAGISLDTFPHGAKPRYA